MVQLYYLLANSSKLSQETDSCRNNEWKISFMANLCAISSPPLGLSEIYDLLNPQKVAVKFRDYASTNGRQINVLKLHS